MVTSRLVSALPRLLLAVCVAGGIRLASPLPAHAAEKTETWLEVRSPHFTVYTNGNEKQARRTVEQFEQIRAVFQRAYPKLRVDPGKPFLILAAKNENTLKSLLPEYWEKKGSTHPAGMFVPGTERHYVALRLDVEGENPYHVVYHEYVHMLNGLNYRHLPVWLDEGIAEFYGNTSITDRDIGLGKIDEASLQLLIQNRLLPLEVLLKVDHDSPYYNEANKTSVFYAQSWAMVHYFNFDEAVLKSNALQNFFHLIQTDVDDLEAARRAFGDLKQFQRNLESYVRQSRFTYLRGKTPADLKEKDFTSRALPPAESAVIRGDFEVRRGRYVEARAMLEQALRLDPSLAQAHEAMGFLLYRQGTRDEAAKYFARAVQLDSKSFLAHYLHAMLLVEGSRDTDSFADAEASLERCISLNPNFAPAHATLASFYSMRQQTLEKALAEARKAAELEPSELHYYLNMGHILLRMERTDDSRVIAQRILAQANAPEWRMAAEALLQEISRFQDYLAQRKRYEEEARASREELETYLRKEPNAETPPTPPASRAASTTPQTATGAPGGRRYGMFGKITQISCTPPAMEVSLTVGGLTMRLHAADALKVDYLTTSWKPPANFNPCKHLKDLTAQVTYRLTPGQPYDGEIVSIEVRR